MDWALFWVKVVSAIGAVLAVLFAAVSIRASGKATRRNIEVLARERQIEFYLDCLRDLAEVAWKDNNVSWAGDMFKTTAAMLPIEMIPFSRACVQLPSTPEAEVLVGPFDRAPAPRTRHVRDVQAEILGAIEKLIAERATLTES